MKLSGELVSLRGRFGGVYFKNDKGTQHVQAMPRHVRYARSGIQLANTDAYSTLAALWGLALICFFTVAWAAYAAAHYFITSSGESKRISGYNWFMHYWLLFPETEQLPYWKPPHSPGDLPSHIVTYKGKQMYYLTPDSWESHSPGGYYWDSGIPWNGETTFRTDDILHFLWWNNTNWVLSQGVGYEPVGLTFYNTSPGIIGYYQNPIDKTRAHVYFGKRPGL